MRSEIIIEKRIKFYWDVLAKKLKIKKLVILVLYMCTTHIHNSSTNLFVKFVFLSISSSFSRVCK